MTQRLDQMASTLSSTTTTANTSKTNNVPSAFEQNEIQSTLEKTALKAAQLTHIPKLEDIPSSTRRIKPLNNFLGQDRARASVEAGISLPYSGYNIFAVGTAGLGKRTMIKRLLQQHAKSMPTPDDWVYVNNFKNARQPLALRFPAGTGPKFQSALHHAWQTILKQLERR
ncbi:Lon-like protease helical domain-containing protein, partial [Acinetobacter soli]